MDNITHSLTGALTAKLLDSKDSGARQDHFARTIFWLIVVAANLPDIDVLFGLFGNPVYSLQMHRGITHSMLFAPLFAILPAAIFRMFSPVKNIKLLWAAAYAGIVLHIFIDLVTPFGTQLLAPVSLRRFALDWMFIIDPVFTVIIGIILYLSRRFIRIHRTMLWTCTFFTVGYLVLAGVAHGIALGKISYAGYGAGSRVTAVAALPQPLNVFHWMGVVQTETGIGTAYFSVFDSHPPVITMHQNDNDRFTQAALATPEGGWYYGFARFPWISSKREGVEYVVEIHDMQFSFDPRLASSFGLADRPAPFTMRFRYAGNGSLIQMTFNR